MTIDAQGGASSPAAAGAQEVTASAVVSGMEAANGAVETPPEAEKPKEDVDFSARFAALSRKERAIVERERQLKQLTNDPSFKEYQTFKELKADPRRNLMKLIESTGLPKEEAYQLLTDLALNDGKPNVELEVKELREQIENDRKAREQQKLDEALDGYKRQIVTQIEKESDAFELMKLYGQDAVDLALQVAVNVFEQQDGKILPPKEVCEAVERHLETQSKMLLGTKKLGVKKELPLDTSEPTDKADLLATGQPQPKQSTAQTKTLTNTNSASAALSKEVPPLDPDARLAWTAARLKARIAGKLV